MALTARRRLAARNAATLSATEPQPVALSSRPAVAERKPAMPVKAPKKDVKSLMKGIVVKKKPKPAAAAASEGTVKEKSGDSHQNAITGIQPVETVSTAKRKADTKDDAAEKKTKT